MELERKWKEIKGYEGKYIVSNYGEIVSLPRYKQNHNKKQYVQPKDILKYINNKNGYTYVFLCNNSKYKNIRLHKIVATAFIPNPKNLPQINHIDGNKQNNRVDNLEWCTASENIKHAYKMGLVKNNNKIKVKQYNIKGELVNSFNSISEASNKTGVSAGAISMCINNKRKTANKFIWKKD